jgi:hypothetical protein
MLGLPLASVGAIGATAGASPAPVSEAATADAGATSGTDAGAVGIAAGGPAEASALEALGGADAVFAGADEIAVAGTATAAGAAVAPADAFTATDRPRNTGAADALRPGGAPGGCAATDRVSDAGRVGAGRARAGAAIGELAAIGGAIRGAMGDVGDAGSVGGIVMATAGRGASKFAGLCVGLDGSVALAAPPVTAGPFAARAGEAIAVARTLVTMARPASGVFSGSAGRSTSEKTTPAPAIAPIAVATRTTRAVRAKLGAGAK